MSQQSPTVFVSADYKYVCDTCEPLKAAISSGKVDWIGFKRGRYPGVEFDSKELDSLRLLAYWNARKEQDWGLPYHRNEGLEIGFVENGTAEFSANRAEKKFDLITPDFITVTKPWQEHAIGNPNLHACKMHFVIIDFGVRRPNQNWRWPSWVLLSKKDKADFADFLQKDKQCIFKSTPEISDIFARVSKTLDKPDMFDISALAILINRLLLELLQIFRASNRPQIQPSPNEDAVKLFIEQLPAYCDQNWTIETMAWDCGLKPSRFAYYCKRLSNLTPNELLNSARLERAMTMLKDDDCQMSITDIALKCGFSTSQYFATKFKKKFGVNPNSLKNSV